MTVRLTFMESPYAGEYELLSQQYDSLDRLKADTARMGGHGSGKRPDWGPVGSPSPRLCSADSIRQSGIVLMQQRDANANTKDQDRVFLKFVLNHLPIGLVGLLMAVIFSRDVLQQQSSTPVSTTMVDIYQRMIKPDGDDAPTSWYHVR